MSAKIHPTAFVDPTATLGSDCELGAFAVIEPGAVVGDGCYVGPHAVVHSGTTIGKRNRIYSGAVVGGDPQDLKYKGQATRLEMGDDNLVREGATVNRGTEEGGGVTKVGNHNLFMAYSHVAHDCVIGDHIVLANSVAIAGHCQVGSHTVVGGLTGLHQFARIGEGSMVGALSRLSKDVLPFSTTSGCDEVKVYGLNKIGLKRRGVARADYEALDHAYHIYLNPQFNATEALKELEGLPDKNALIQQLLQFIKTSSRGVYR